MEKKKIFKRLKNGKSIEFFYKQNDDVSYTIRLNYKNDKFYLHYYFLDGNDVFDESNYKDEVEVSFIEFDELLKNLQLKFPGIQINI